MAGENCWIVMLHLPNIYISDIALAMPPMAKIIWIRLMYINSLVQNQIW